MRVPRDLYDVIDSPLRTDARTAMKQLESAYIGEYNRTYTANSFLIYKQYVGVSQLHKLRSSLAADFESYFA